MTQFYERVITYPWYDSKAFIFIFYVCYISCEIILRWIPRDLIDTPFDIDVWNIVESKTTYDSGVEFFSAFKNDTMD